MPPITFIHSADWQLGKPFARVPEESKRHSLQQERFHVIDRIGNLIRENDASFLLVAGDLFDSPSVTKSVVSQACAKIGALKVPVYAIPGNHDPGGPGSIWESDFFRHERSQLAPNLHILLESKPVLTESAVLFPCPLLRRHESADPTLWLRPIGESEAPPDWGQRCRILIAHGSITAFQSAPDDEDAAIQPNRLNLESLPQDHFDYIALGDWHGTKNVAPKAWYPGTPEIDRFPKGDENDPGNVLVVRAQRALLPKVEKIRTAKFQWHQLEHDFTGTPGLDALQTALSDLLGCRAQEDLLRLDLRGPLGITARNTLQTLLTSLESRLLRLKLADQTRIAPSQEELDALARRLQDPLISRVASRLAEMAAGSDEQAASAQIALCELHAQIPSR